MHSNSFYEELQDPIALQSIADPSGFKPWGLLSTIHAAVHCVHRAQLFFKPKDVSVRVCLPFFLFLISVNAVFNKITTVTVMISSSIFVMFGENKNTLELWKCCL